MSQWSRETWAAIKPIFQQTIVHPFLKSLMDGSLDRETFHFYLGQDALYLDDFGKVLAGLALKSPNRRHVENFLRFAGDTIAVERELHRSFLGQFDFSAARPSPTCLLYTSFMHRQLALAPLETAVATVLPCFWIYKEVGDFILAAPQTPGNPYQGWIDTYGGEEYGQAVTQAVAMADELAEAAGPDLRREMTDAFVLCSKMEWMFWDSAWRREAWPL